MNSKHIYQTLCETRKTNQESYRKHSGLHRHHITPRHIGGLDEESNYTYLTVREHIIAHYLLWRIYRNVNDLRSMKMLGANLSPQRRKSIGEHCRDNFIGIFSEEYRKDKQRQSERCRRSAETQKQNQTGTFNPETRNRIASQGGKVGGASQKKNRLGIHNPSDFKKNASLGGKALKGMICVTNGKHRTRIRPENLGEYLNAGYVLGFTLSS